MTRFLCFSVDLEQLLLEKESTINFARKEPAGPTVKSVLDNTLDSDEAPKKRRRRWSRSGVSAATDVIGDVQVRIEISDVEPKNIKVEPK